MTETGDTDCGQGSVCLSMIPTLGSALHSAYVGIPARSQDAEATASIEADTIAEDDHRAVDEMEVYPLFQPGLLLCLDWVSRLALAATLESVLPWARPWRQPGQGTYIAAELFYIHCPHLGR
jgi:hypothetical protein